MKDYPINIKEILYCECYPIYPGCQLKAYRKKKTTPTPAPVGITMDSTLITLDDDTITLDNE
jgi:hypothetical protein